MGSFATLDLVAQSCFQRWSGPSPIDFDLPDHPTPSSETSIACLTILCHPDVRRVGERAVLEAVASEGEALLARQVLELAPPRGGETRPLLDRYLSRRPIRFAAARFGGIRIDCNDTGTRVVADGDWIPTDRVFLGVEVKRGIVLMLANRIVLLLHNVPAEIPDDLPDLGLTGESSTLIEVRRQIQGLLPGTGPVLLRGEKGTGKNQVGEALHRHGARRDQPYVVAHLDDEALHGALADLTRRAAGGILYLDAVDKLSKESQNVLLRTLETTPDPPRVIAATSARASRRWNAASGPLLERLLEDIVDLPPLAKRRDDIGRLLYHFLRDELAKIGALDRLADPGPYAQPWLSVQVVAHLAGYAWPRNVAQLRSVARQLVLDHRGSDEIRHGPQIEQLLDSTAESSEWKGDEDLSGPIARPQFREPSEISDAELLTALRAHRWQARPTAEQLEISEEALFGLIEKLSQNSPRRRSRVHRSSSRDT